MVKEGKPPEDVELLLLRNGRDGFKRCRMLDVKMGRVTAVGGWQGKAAYRAWVQNNTVDAMTNSARQGFRLEGFDCPPAALRSVEDMVLEAGFSKAKKKQLS